MDDTDIELHYDTPYWAQANPQASSTPPRVPHQAAPMHETAPPPIVPAPAAAPDPDLPTSGEWHELLPRRRARGVVLAATLLGAVAGLVTTILTQSPVAVAATIICTGLAIMNRTALITVTPTVVTLDGSNLRVRHNGHDDVFALADPDRRIETVGLPDQDGWRLRLEAPDQRVVELSASQVDPATLHRVVRAHREVAAIKRRAHEERLRR
jgi:hypothetical protein